MKAAVYIGHGGPSPRINEKLELFIQEALKELDVPIKTYAIREGGTQTIEQAIHDCVEQGATEIIAQPVYLLSGKHANEEIPYELNKCKERFPQTSITYGTPMCDHAIINEIIMDRLKGVTEEALMLISHGSSDPLATAALQEQADKLKEKGYAVEIGYLMTEPFFKTQAEKVLKEGYKTVALLPYALSSGGFTTHIQEQIQELLKEFPNQKLVMCENIGFDPRLKQLLKEKWEQAAKM